MYENVLYTNEFFIVCMAGGVAGVCLLLKISLVFNVRKYDILFSKRCSKNHFCFIEMIYKIATVCWVVSPWKAR